MTSVSGTPPALAKVFIFGRDSKSYCKLEDYKLPHCLLPQQPESPEIPVVSIAISESVFFLLQRKPGVYCK